MEESGVHCTAVYLKQYSPCSVLGPGVRRAQWPDDVFLVVTNFFTSSAPDMQVVLDDVGVQYREMAHISTLHLLLAQCCISGDFVRAA